MDSDVFLSLLALDSYNRGYGANVGGLTETGGIGSANIRPFVLGEQEGWQAVNFYAIAYNWNGETIISYRGTNEPSPFLSAGGILTRLSLGAASSLPQKYCTAA